ncbi:MAG: hypothetical protein R3C19_17485 [Planctomycetaceae bacterium]
MRKTNFAIGSLLLASMASLGMADNVFAKAADDKQPSVAPTFVIEEDVWVRFVEEPSDHMKRAHENFLKKDFKAAAHDLWLAGGFLHAAASNAVGDARTALTASAREIDQLAKDVEAGGVKSVTTLENAFARAEHALAHHHHTMAKTAIRNQRGRTGGHYLRSATNHVENAARWTGHKLEAGAEATANGVRMVAGRLVEGTGFVPDEVGKGVTWVGTEIEKLGKVIEPHQRPGAVSAIR